MLSKGRIDAEALQESLALLRRGSPATRGYAVDVSPWPRCGAESSPGRCYLYHPSKHPAGQPIVASWAHQLLVELGFEHDSWVAPVGARRVRPKEDANIAAAEQVAGQARWPPGQESALAPSITTVPVQGKRVLKVQESNPPRELVGRDSIFVGASLG